MGGSGPSIVDPLPHRWRNLSSSARLPICQEGMIQRGDFFSQNYIFFFIIFISYVIRQLIDVGWGD